LSGTPDVADTLVEVAGGDDAPLRAEALRHLGSLGDERADDLITDAIRDGDSNVSFAAIAAASDMQSASTENALVALLLDTAATQEARGAAANALRGRGGAAAARYRSQIDALLPPSYAGIW
jgi:HEAT repeat protein